MKITIVGLGRQKGDLTASGLSAIKSSKKIVLRSDKLTEKAELLALNLPFETLDFLYEKCTDFVELNTLMFNYVKELAKEFGEVTYLAEGSGLEDDLVKMLKEDNSIEVDIILSVPKAESALKDCYPTGNHISISAQSFSKYKYFDACNLPIVIYNVDDKFVCGEVKAVLSANYGDEMECYFVSYGVKKLKVYEIDMQKDKEYTYKTAIVVAPKKLSESVRFSFSQLFDIMEVLRGDNGCPWDKAQTHKSTRNNILEEAFELAEAIDLNDSEKLCEESGDLLLQTLLQAKIASDGKEFDITDVNSVLGKKLVSRHTHIFSKDKASTAEEALHTWEQNKKIEKNQETLKDSLESIATTLPQLTRAEKVCKKIKKAENAVVLTSEIKDKLLKLLTLSDEALSSQLGELLYGVVELSHGLKQSPEEALEREVKKVILAVKD